MSNAFPDGYFRKNIILFGHELNADTFVSRGFEVGFSDPRYYSVREKNNFHDVIQGFLGLIGEEYHVQINWSTDSDYSRELSAYHDFTLRNARNPSIEFLTRAEIYERYSDMMNRGELRRERLRIYLTKKISAIPSGKLDDASIDEICAREATIFEDTMSSMVSMFPVLKLQAMTDQEHYWHYMLKLNPSMRHANLEQSDVRESLNPNSSILENVWMGGGTEVDADDDDVPSIYMDGYYQANLVIRDWPKESVYPGIFNQLTDCLNQNIEITQNIYPLEVESEIKKREKDANNLIKDMEADRSKAAVRGVELSATQGLIQSLAIGKVAPLSVLTVIRVWGETKRDLNRRLAAVRSAIVSMRGAKIVNPIRFATQTALFVETLPGWTASRYRGFDLYAQSDFLADLIPFSVSFTGDIEDAWAIYEGESKTLVGFKEFRGETPLHTCLFGRSGGGKSVISISIDLQTVPYYGVEVIIEEGLSWAMYTKVRGYETLRLRADGEVTINYFDTHGLPLDQAHVAEAVAFCMIFVGESGDDERSNRYRGYLSKYITKCYDDSVLEWKSHNSEAWHDVERLALVIKQHIAKNMAGQDVTFTDGYLELMEMRRNNPSNFNSLIGDLSEDEVYDFSTSEDGRVKIRSLAIAFFEHEDFPVHSTLYERMTYGLDPHDKRHPSRDMEIGSIATALGSWTQSKGINGAIFDGIHNLPVYDQIMGLIGGKGRLNECPVLHIEMGDLGENNPVLRQAGGFLVSTMARKLTVRLPRSMRKKVKVEEAAKFLAVKNADKIIKEFYAQFRKYSAMFNTIFQQYSQLKDSAIKGAVFGNSNVFRLMAQQDRTDLEDFSLSLPLPETARNQINNFILPANQTGEKCSYFCLFEPNGEQTLCGTTVVRVSPETLLIADSGGETYERRLNELERYDSALQYVLEKGRD